VQHLVAKQMDGGRVDRSRSWRQLTRKWHGPLGPKFLAILLAAAALAEGLLALVYLPLEARFTVANSAGYTITAAAPESWLTRIFSCQFSPSATTGLFVSILGALLLVVGVVMMRGARPDARE
jgi:hypothetical protein